MFRARVLLFCVLSVAGARASEDRSHRDSCHHGHGHGHGHGTPAPPDLSEAPVTVTPSGSIRGSWLYTRRGRPLESYRGIRFASPPVGDLRFKPPQPIHRYEGEVNATVDGPACPQPVFDNYNVDEDCLRLNVYTPGKGRVALPVVVYFHPGGFYSVSGRSDVAGPNYLLDRDIVLVTVNYRLASLGFLSTGDKHAPGNNGYKDQVAALRWVRRNIAAFGGDPAAVTLAGYSAGSFSVSLHMVSPMSAGLFHRAISMSGSPISQVELPHDQKDLAIKQAELLGCPTHSSKTILDCLRTKSSKELGDSLYQFFEFDFDPVLIWVPIIEKDYGQERFLTEHPLESIRNGRLHAVPYIVSQTQDEFFWKAFSILNNATLTKEMDTEWHRIAPISFYLAPPSRSAANTLRNFYLGGHNGGHLLNDSETAASLGRLYNDAIIGFGVHTLANLMAVYSPEPLYYYEYAYIGNSSHYVDPVTDKPVRRNPNPTPDTPELTFSWPRMTHARRRYLRIDTDFSVRENLYEDRFQVWERLYSPKDCEYCTY